MIRLRDASVLAYTKLRLHRIRTGITVGIAGLLFGLLLVIVLVSQGVFNSLDSFGNTGLNNRYIVALLPTPSSASFDVYAHLEDKTFIAEVEAEHAATVARKQAAAKKYNVSYDAKTEDPLPVIADPTTKKKSVSEAAVHDSPIVAAVVAKRAQKNQKQFSVDEYIKRYSSAKPMGTANPVGPRDGALTYMKDGKELREHDKPQPDMAFEQEPDPSLSVLNGSLAKPFVTTKFDPSKGEIPAVIPYKQAEKLLGLKPLPAATAAQAKYDRLAKVRRDVGQVTAAFCYRNAASQNLLNIATSQAAEMKQNKNNRDYVSPAVLYKLPSLASCAAPKIVSDKRTETEKKADENRVLFEKEVGTYAGEPKQQKIVVRGVGISSDFDMASSSSIGQMVTALMSMPLVYGAWVVPDDLLASTPAQARPSAVFGAEATQPKGEAGQLAQYLVEFADKNEARRLLDSQGFFGGGGMMNDGQEVFAMPFGSSSLIYDELKRWLSTIIMWTLIAVGAIASIVLTAVIGRTIADGRRESAVFRAIGARRLDIASIYGVYAFFLSLRIVVFAFVVGAALTLLVELLYWQDATLAARLAYAASDTSAEFHFFGLNSWYVLAIAGTIIAAALLASLIPILRNARRNPIQDMRDE